MTPARVAAAIPLVAGLSLAAAVFGAPRLAVALLAIAVQLAGVAITILFNREPLP